MKTIYSDSHTPDYRALREVAEVIRKGGVAVYPTDTIYGIGCDVYSKQGLEKIARAKGRDERKPFSFICKDIAQISQFAFIPNWGYRMMTRMLPGPYTVILEARRTNLPKKMTGRRNTVGVRIPDLPLVTALMEMLDDPLVSTSANVAGEEPAAQLDELPSSFTGQVDIALDAGPLLSDASTVVDFTGSEPITLREGKGEIFW